LDLPELRQREQAYQIAMLDDNTLVVIGSDKLGTIYGLYAISEYIGVSPLHFWGDVAPVRREIIEISDDISAISRTPSVKYRGFFINDEWPAFGTWTFHHFGGFTAEMYDHIFDLLLRLKGNYLWPAMWTSSFALDGPGAANEVLADEYGITIGASHHEPLLRASEEWDKVRGADTPYGNEWNYLSNKDGLLNYWRDAIKRSGHLNKMIMMGIRGERDSELLGPDATLANNVELLKDAITAQKQVIAQEAPGTENPMMLALYKEVEEYYYGSDTVPGLKGWDGLDGVTLMFCEDNFGFMRSLPDTDQERAGAGMYYHLDYHGGPISYEWMPSISFERIHDQMSLAYDYGITNTWVVNVGDLKFNEVPLAFFMAMAYDMDKFGRANANAVAEYTHEWIRKTFPAVAPQIQAEIAAVMQGFIRLNSMRRPEALNAKVYHPAHYLEADRIFAAADEIQDLDRDISAHLNETELLAYQSMIGIPARASANLVQMMVSAAKNEHFAKQGKPVANAWADAVTGAIAADKAIAEEIKTFKNGKWFGHEKEAHIGFTTWNEDGNQYPIRMVVQPGEEPRMLVSRADTAKVHHKTYGGGNAVIVDDFEFSGQPFAVLEIANDGPGEFDFEIEGLAQYPWLQMVPAKGTIQQQFPVLIEVNRDLLPTGSQAVTADLKITGGGTSIPVKVSARRDPISDGGELPANTFLAGPGDVIVIPASGFASNTQAEGAQWAVLPMGGRDGDAIRVVPTTSSFAAENNGPTVTYQAFIQEPGAYTVEVWQVPTGVVQRGKELRFTLDTGAGKQVVTAISADVNAGNPGESRWAGPVLDNIRKTAVEVELPGGVVNLTIGAVEPNLVLEKILLYPAATVPPVSYLGPPASVTA
jgi:hypothetical protein